MHNYSRGASKWLYQKSTIDKIRLLWNKLLNDQADISRLLDSSPANDSINYIKRISSAKTKFPALFSIYFAGLDHWAHDFGMGEYTKFFKESTDVKIADVVTALKDADEFNNKIFIITADHGHTEMPTDLPKIPGDDGKLYGADISCKLNLKDFDKAESKFPELANNNLHIWELAEMFRIAGENDWGDYKVLAPQEIAKLFKDKKQVELPHGATEEIDKANVIVALNGPMAHIYVKGMNGWQDKDNINVIKLSEVAGLFKTFFVENGINLGKEEKSALNKLLSSVDSILIRDGGIYKIFKGVEIDANDNILGPDTEAITNTSFDAAKYINAMKRIEGLNNPDRSGDIILIFKDFTNDVDTNRYTSGVACKSWHGSLNASDSYVPFIIAYPGGNKIVIEDLKTKVCATGECSGNWALKNFISEIIKNQYSGQ